MSNIHPHHIINSTSGLRFSLSMGEARDWFKQFPNDSFSHLEWGSHAWPGGYEIHYHTKDFGILCHNCANAELLRTIDPDDDQFFIVAAEINYEDQSLYCDHCNSRIQSAYGEDES